MEVALANDHAQLLLTEPSMDRALKKFFGNSFKYKPFIDTMLRVFQQNHLAERLFFRSSYHKFLLLLFAHNYQHKCAVEDVSLITSKYLIQFKSVIKPIA